MSCKSAVSYVFHVNKCVLINYPEYVFVMNSDNLDFILYTSLVPKAMYALLISM